MARSGGDASRLTAAVGNTLAYCCNRWGSFDGEQRSCWVGWNSGASPNNRR